MPLDPGRAELEARVTAMTPDERALVADRMRRDAFLLAWAAADEEGPMDKLSEAEFILRRLYPEMTDEQLAFVRHDLEREQAAGRWDGFLRPTAR